MGGFFMLFRLFVIRWIPLLFLTIVKEKKQKQKTVIAMAGIYIISFIAASCKVVGEMGGIGLFLIPLFMFPHYICYIFGGWILLKCLWFSWSVRVWRRIVFVSSSCILIGIYLERYWNLKILHKFFEIIK